MDPRRGLETGLYTLDQQPLLRSSGSYASLPPSHLLGSSASSLALQQLHSYGGYGDQNLARSDVPSLSQYAPPPPVHSLSSGQGYYTVESLEGGPLMAGDGLIARPPSLLQEADRTGGLGQLGFEGEVWKGLGQRLPSFGGAGESGPYLTAHVPQEVDGGRAGLLRVDGGGMPYLRQAHSGLVPAAYEDVVPSRLAAFGPELELRRRSELLAALEQRRELEYEAHLREANREAAIREAHIREVRLREAQLEHAARIREARLSFLREQKVPERRGRLPPGRIEGPLSRPKRTNTGLNPTWCSVCQIECHTPFNLKSHLGGKRHKLKLEEGAEKKNEQAEEKKEGEKVEDEDNKPELTTGEANGTENVESDEKVKEEVGGVDDVSEAANLKKRSLSEEAETVASKKLKNEESVLEGAKSDGLDEKPERPPRTVEKCDICNVTCIGKVALESHLKGKKHANNVKRLRGKVPKIDTDKAAQVDPNPSEEGADS